MNLFWEYISCNSGEEKMSKMIAWFGSEGPSKNGPDRYNQILIWILKNKLMARSHIDDARPMRVIVFGGTDWGYVSVKPMGKFRVGVKSRPLFFLKPQSVPQKKITRPEHRRTSNEGWRTPNARQRIGKNCKFSMRGPCVPYVWPGIYEREGGGRGGAGI